MRDDQLRQVRHPAASPPKLYDASVRRDAPRSNLPSLLTSFVGREREVESIAARLAAHRLVTLTGAPGVGKTRLGLRVAATVEGALPDGVWLVELAPLGDPALVARAVAEVLDVPEERGRSLVATLAEYLGRRALLVVLDNCEHLIGSAAALAEALLHACPRLRILATSREPLAVAGEVAWRVPSLTVPNTTASGAAGMTLPALLQQYEAARLFAERARVAAPSVELTDEDAAPIARICTRLDGIPLALELAAARVRALSVHQIDARLDDRFSLLTGGNRTALPRYRTLRGAIDWSYELLSDPGRTLLRQLAVFAGGWTLEAAEAVCDIGDHGGPARDLEDLLLQLVDKSLVQVDAEGALEPRYRLLEMIRQYGLEQMREAGEEADVRRRHLAWFADLAEHGQAGIHGPDGAAWMDRLGTELDNLRAALGWSVADPTGIGAEAGLRMAGALFQFWYFRDHLTEGLGWLERTLARDQECGRAGGRRATAPGTISGSMAACLPEARTGAFGAHPRVVALNELGALAQDLWSLERATGPIEEAVGLARHVGDRRGIAHASATLGIIARTSGRYERAATLLEESLAIFRDLDDRFGIWRSLSSLGDVLCELNDVERAQSCWEESLAVARSMGHPWGVAKLLRQLGSLAYRRGDLDRATVLLEESLVCNARLRATRGRNWSLLELGRVALERDDPRRAATCFTESLALCRAADDRRGVARCLEGLASVAARDAEDKPAARWTCAARLLGAAAALRAAVGSPVPPIERPALERAMTAARERLGEAGFASAWAEGQAMPVDLAVELGIELAHQAQPPAPEPAPNAPPTRPSPVDPGLSLTARELEVAALIGRGYPNRQIAEELVISERTAETHARNIRDKLGLASRAHVIAWAIDRGLVAGPRSTR